MKDLGDNRALEILSVTHYMPPHQGGIERVAEALVEGLRARGHAVRWLASATPARAGWDGHLLRVPALNALEVRLGVPYPLWSPAEALTVWEEVSRADLVHVHDCLYLGSCLAALACRAQGKPLVVTQHVGYVPFGPALDRVQRVAYHTLGRAVLGSASAVVTLSAHVEDFFTSLRLRPRFRRIPNAVDDTRFRPARWDERPALRARWGVPEGGPVVLFVGRLVPKKGVAEVLAAQRALAARGTTLLVCGEGPLRPSLEGVPGLVHHPSVPHAAMPELYHLSDALLLPSRGEGLPLSLQEALATGLPAVVSDDPAFALNVGDFPGVRLAADADGLVRAVQRALEEHATEASRASIAREAHARWGGERVLDAYLALYRELLAG
ncbi:MAG: glycosyltransferase family 4 protein [Deltaproteobacteria bacterium]|nr:glycosyltransferase family 4 protein [Deltaproteobacteria bacterium]